MGTRSRLVASTIDLVRRDGVAGTGISELLEHSGIARRSVYLHFPGGKAELVTAATVTAGGSMATMIEEIVSASGSRAALDAFTEYWRHVIVDSDYTAGCPVVAATLGRSDAAEAADAAGVAFADWAQIIANDLRREGIPDETARSLAMTAVAAIEGAVIVSLASRDTSVLDHVNRHLTELLDAHLAAVDTP